MKSVIDLKELVEASLEHRLDTNHYPNNLFDLAFEPSNKGWWLGPYIKEKDILDPWGEPYHYLVDPANHTIIIYTLGSDHVVGGQDQASDLIILAKGSDKMVFSQAFKPMTK